MKKAIIKKKKIIIALSGGVDSAVAAAELLAKGYDVLGIHFVFFGSEQKISNQAALIAKKLGLPIKVVDARKEFKNTVIRYFLESYRNGLTPNPCVLCNKEIKFKLLFDQMKKSKADYVATGHYARIIKSSAKGEVRQGLQKTKSKNVEKYAYKLLQAKDSVKDQSYFLYRLSQEDLSRIIFPLGERKKTDVKKRAEEMNLPVLGGESQDICFLEGCLLGDYLQKYISPPKGDMVDESGTPLGRHKGLPFYTIGQRRGIEIGGTGPYYVVKKNAKKNELTVTGCKSGLLADSFQIEKANWIKSGTKFPIRAKVKIRYQAPSVSAIIKKSSRGKYTVKSTKKMRAVAPGQSAVFYQHEEVVGGGIIL